MHHVTCLLSVAFLAAALLPGCALDRDGLLFGYGSQGGAPATATGTPTSSGSTAGPNTTTSSMATDASASSTSASSTGANSASGVGGMGGQSTSNTSGGLGGAGGSGGSGGSPPTNSCLNAIALGNNPPCSSSSNDAASITITNDCKMVTLEAFWVKYDCSEESYGTIAPGKTWQLGSYETHPWRLRNADTGDLLYAIPPLTGNTTFTFGPMTPQ